MAKGTKAGAILVKLVSTAATGYFYVRVSERSGTSWRRMTLCVSDRLDLFFGSHCIRVTPPMPPFLPPFFSPSFLSLDARAAEESQEESREAGDDEV